MRTEENEIIFATRFPFSIPFGIVIDIIAIVSFSYHMIFGRIPILEGLIYITLVITLVDLVVCRYAGKVIFLKDKIVIKYFFPWRQDYEIGIEKIKDLKTESSVQVYLSNYSRVIITLGDDKTERINIVSWYGSMNGVKIVEEKFNAEYKNR